MTVAERLHANQRRCVKLLWGCVTKKIIAVAVLALPLIGSAPRQAAAICIGEICPPPPKLVLPPHAAAVGAGPWIVGGAIVAVASVIAYADVINIRQHRELTFSEATGALAFPFLWVFWPQLKQMQETQMSFNLQYLQLQNQMQNENRQYSTVSNIMKTKHGTVKHSISNIR